MLTPLDIILRLVTAVLIGGILGSERESHGKPAGLRTHMLVSLASALIVIVSIQFFFDTNPDSVSRIITGLVTGLGFLGAGAIIRHEDHVEGITTAATIWVVALLGIGAGLGYYMITAVTTLLVLVVLFMGRAEKKLHQP